MTRSRLWLAFSTVLSVGMGFIGGTMYTRRATAMDAEVGRLYEIDGEVYIDGALVDFLTPRAESRETRPCSALLPCPGDWTALRFRAVTLFVKQLHEQHILPRQRDGLYSVRRLRGDSPEARGDRAVQEFLQEMIDLGLVDRVGRWSSWADVRIDLDGGRSP